MSDFSIEWRHVQNDEDEGRCDAWQNQGMGQFAMAEDIRGESARCPLGKAQAGQRFWSVGRFGESREHGRSRLDAFGNGVSFHGVARRHDARGRRYPRVPPHAQLRCSCKNGLVPRSVLLEKDIAISGLGSSAALLTVRRATNAVCTVVRLQVSGTVCLFCAGAPASLPHLVRGRLALCPVCDALPRPATEALTRSLEVGASGAAARASS